MIAIEDKTQRIIMKIKFMMLALCFSLVLVATSCSKVKPGPSSGYMGARVYDTSVYFYHTAAYSKNKKQEIIVAFWDNDPNYPLEHAPSMMLDSPNIECNLTRSDSAAKFQCVGKFDGKTGKGEVNINGEKFDVSNGRLFLINTHVKPVKVIQVNEQFNLPPFDNLSCLGNFPFTNKKRISKKSVVDSFSSAQEKFEYLAKHNKTVAAFLAASKKHSEKNKTKDSKKKD